MAARLIEDLWAQIDASFPPLASLPPSLPAHVAARVIERRAHEQALRRLGSTLIGRLPVCFHSLNFFFMKKIKKI